MRVLQTSAVGKCCCGVSKREVLEGEVLYLKPCSGMLRKRSFAKFEKKCCADMLERSVSEELCQGTL